MLRAWFLAFQQNWHLNLMTWIILLSALGFAVLCLWTTGWRRPLSLERSGAFLLLTSLWTSLFYGAYRLVHEDQALASMAKMLGEANYAFLIVFMRSQRTTLSRRTEVRASLLVLAVALVHLSLNLSLTGLWQMGVMTVQVLILIGWVALEAWWLWLAQRSTVRLLLAVLVTGHWLSELTARLSLWWAAAQGDATMQAQGWTDAMQDWMWVTFFLGFMAQLAIAGVVAQALRQDKDRLEQLVRRIEGMLQEKEALVMTLLASNAARKSDPHLASLAHELRQPLGSIQLNAEYLTSGQRLNKAEETEVLQEILRENHRAVAIVQGLRSLFADKAPDYDVLDWSAFVSAWVQRQTQVLQQQFGVALRLRAQAGVRVRGNAVQLEMVLQNLINNAVEAMTGKEPGLIEVTLVAHGKLALLDVVDNGAGVPQELSEKMFEMNVSTKSQGMGLGLWLSRRIAQFHRGDLVLVPQPQGARMRLTLPMEAL